MEERGQGGAKVVANCSSEPIVAYRPRFHFSLLLRYLGVAVGRSSFARSRLVLQFPPSGCWRGDLGKLNFWSFCFGSGSTIFLNFSICFFFFLLSRFSRFIFDDPPTESLGFLRFLVP